MENEGFYYWSGDSVHVNGFVSNVSPYDLNYPQVHYVVKTTGGVKVAEGTAPVAAHLVGESEAAFAFSVELPALVGQELNITVWAWGYQETLPTPFGLDYVGKSVSVSGGLRTYTFEFANCSTVPVHDPVLSGVEWDNHNGVIDVLYCRENVTIPPGGHWTAHPVGYYPDAVVTDYGASVSVVPEATFKLVWRFRNLRNGFYLWTADLNERNTIVRELQDTWLLEGPAYSLTLATNTAPLWRFRNIQGGYYLYSGDAAEKANIIATLGQTWKYEGPTFKVSMNRSGAPVWRFRNLQDGTYLYSSDPAEKNNIVATLSGQWLLEGPAYYLAP